MKTKLKLEQKQWESLLDALRGEVQEYGSLLSILNEQQQSVLKRDTDSIVSLNASITQQLGKNSKMREAREEVIRGLAGELELEDKSDVSVQDLMPYFPHATKGLVHALVDEIWTLMEKTKRKAGQNQLLLLKSFQATEDLLEAILPGDNQSKTYDRKGQVEKNTNANLGRVQAAV